MNDNGWIKVHRKMLQNPVVWKDSDYVAVWLYLLLNATHKEYPVLFKGKKIMLQPGQLITGRYAITSSTGVESNKVYRILNFFESEQQIAKQRSSKNSLITLLNWDIYQNDEKQNEKQMQNKCKTVEHKQEYKNIKNKRNNGFSDSRLYDYEALESKLTVVKSIGER